MNQYQLPVSIAAITNEFKQKFFKPQEELVGSYIIKIKELDSSIFYPICILTNQNIHIKIADKFISIPIKKISEHSVHEEYLDIKWDKENIRFGLVDSGLKLPDKDFNTLFNRLIDILIKDGKPDLQIVNNLPDQSSYLSTTKKSLLILISAMVMMTFGFFLSSINFNLSFLLFVGGILLILYLAIRFILRVDN